MGAHWKGVKGFGTKKDLMLTWHLPFLCFFWNLIVSDRNLVGKLGIARISSSVSVGSPSIK